MIDEYLSAVSAELHRSGRTNDRALQEVRDHLLDAVEAGRRRGLALDLAERKAIERLGPPALVAESLAAEAREADRQREAPFAAVALAFAIAAGLAIAYVDSRPHWDDTGITVFAMLGVAFILGCVLPRQPWRWALGVGVWIPLSIIARTGNAGAAVMFVVVLFPLAGAYGGAAVRRALS